MLHKGNSFRFSEPSLKQSSGIRALFLDLREKRTTTPCEDAELPFFSRVIMCMWTRTFSFPDNVDKMGRLDPHWA